MAKKRDFIDVNFSHILKLNGFKKEGRGYLRDDGIHIDSSAGMYNLVYPSGDVIYCHTKEQLMGNLVLRNICTNIYF